MELGYRGSGAPTCFDQSCLLTQCEHLRGEAALQLFIHVGTSSSEQWWLGAPYDLGGVWLVVCVVVSCAGLTHASFVETHWLRVSLPVKFFNHL